LTQVTVLSKRGLGGGIHGAAPINGQDLDRNGHSGNEKHAVFNFFWINLNAAILPQVDVCDESRRQHSLPGPAALYDDHGPPLKALSSSVRRRTSAHTFCKLLGLRTLSLRAVVANVLVALTTSSTMPAARATPHSAASAIISARAGQAKLC
jgi:hypothetical protein